MSSEAQRVVVIEYASRQVSPNAIKRTIKGLKIKTGDKLLILRVLLEVTNPLGHKVRVKPNSIFGATPKMIEEEIARKKEEYINNEEIKQVLEECQTAKIEYEIEVQAEFSPKVAVCKAAQSFRATWVVLDRQMKKDRNFLFKKLRCGISRIRSDSRIEKMREPKKVTKKNDAVNQPVETGNPQANEMISGNTGEENSQRKSPPPLENPEPMSAGGSADHSQYEQTNSPITNSPLSGRAGSANFSADHPLEEQMPSSIADSLSNGKAGSSTGVPDHPLEEPTQSPIVYSSSNGKSESSNGVPDHPLNVQMQSSIANSLSNGIAGSNNGILDHSLDVQTPSPIANHSSNGKAGISNGVLDHPLDLQTPSLIANHSSNGKAGIGNGVLDHPLDVQMPSPMANLSSNGKTGISNGVPDHSLDMQTPSPIANYPSNGNAGSSNGVLDQPLDMPAQPNISSSEKFVTTKCPTSGNAEASSSSSTNTKCSHIHFPSEAAATDTMWETTWEEWKTTWKHCPRFPDIDKLKLARSFYEGQIQK